MGKNTVFDDEHEPTLAELKALGREQLHRLWSEAARRRDRQRSVYGAHRPGRQDFLDWSLQRDMDRIDAALHALDEADRRAAESLPEE